MQALETQLWRRQLLGGLTGGMGTVPEARGTEGQKGPEVAWGVSRTHVLVQGLDMPPSEASPHSGELQE